MGGLAPLVCVTFGAAPPPRRPILTLNLQTPERPPLQVFDRKDWDALLARCILPKLAFALQQVCKGSPLSACVWM